MLYLLVEVKDWPELEAGEWQDEIGETELSKEPRGDVIDQLLPPRRQEVRPNGASHLQNITSVKQYFPTGWQ